MTVASQKCSELLTDSDRCFVIALFVIEHRRAFVTSKLSIQMCVELTNDNVLHVPPHGHVEIMLNQGCTQTVFYTISHRWYIFTLCCQFFAFAVSSNIIVYT